MIWEYGITTVPERRETLLPRTLASLARAGFDRPRLFIDGLDDCETCKQYKSLGLPLTSRCPRMHEPTSTFGNWFLALAELYYRNPDADRYAIFQDDILACGHLKEYLTKCSYPERGYWNLYTFPENRAYIDGNPPGWWPSNQRGFGALGLVFSKRAVIDLLSSVYIAERPARADLHGSERRWKSIDGAILSALHKVGYREYVHNPSLLQHTGLDSALNRAPTTHPLADNFPGEDFDCRSLLKC